MTDTVWYDRSGLIYRIWSRDPADVTSKAPSQAPGISESVARRSCDQSQDFENLLVGVGEGHVRREEAFCRRSSANRERAVRDDRRSSGSAIGAGAGRRG